MVSCQGVRVFEGIRTSCVILFYEIKPYPSSNPEEKSATKVTVQLLQLDRKVNSYANKEFRYASKFDCALRREPSLSICSLTAIVSIHLLLPWPSNHHAFMFSVFWVLRKLHLTFPSTTFHPLEKLIFLHSCKISSIVLT